MGLMIVKDENHIKREMIKDLKAQLAALSSRHVQ